jgi:hypothetical protein
MGSPCEQCLHLRQGGGLVSGVNSLLQPSQTIEVIQILPKLLSLVVLYWTGQDSGM